MTELAAEDHRVWADAPRLTQVFWNLLNNAVKFTPDGGTIAVRTCASEDGDRLGRARSPTPASASSRSSLPRIFDAFEQGEPSITRRFGGLGLGLAISKAIVELHGGRITARERRATARAPPSRVAPARRRLARRRPEPARPRPRRGAGPAPPRPPLRILLVEDHPDTAEAMAELLRALGHQVTVGGNVAAGAGRGRRPETAPAPASTW